MSGRTLTAGLLALMLASGSYAQSCDDLDPCTVNDICAAGACRGTFQDGAPCDDHNPCTVNDVCQAIGQICRGTPGEAGTPCSGGCGTCQPIVGSPGLLTCGGDPANAGQPCDPGVGPCITGSCLFNGGVATCLPRPVECDDTDGNPCTDHCDFQTGQCAVDAPKCIPTCETCDQETGACRPASLGAACDDGNVCTAQSRCEFNDAAQRTFCMAGEPTGPSPTSTQVGSSPTPTQVGSSSPTPTESGGASPTSTEPGGASPTPTELAGTPTTPPTPGACVGDCNGNGVVVVNELIIGVNIALGSGDIGDCPAFDINSSGTVEVNELIGGVNALLNGCV
jgi:hypothetical protein